VLALEEPAAVPSARPRSLTVAPPEQPGGTDISPEPKSPPAVRPFTDALVADGIPSAVLSVDDIDAEHERLVGLGVEFTQPPTPMGPVTLAVFDDTCGNLMQLAQFTG